MNNYVLENKKRMIINIGYVQPYQIRILMRLKRATIILTIYSTPTVSILSAFTILIVVIYFSFLCLLLYEILDNMFLDLHIWYNHLLHIKLAYRSMFQTYATSAQVTSDTT